MEVNLTGSFEVEMSKNFYFRRAFFMCGASRKNLTFKLMEKY
jgi:hypothetical protein